MKICNIPGCGRKHEAKGYCSKHYKRIVLKGSINLSTEDLRKVVPDPMEDFLSKIKKLEGGCWLWTGYTRKDGYGQLTTGRKPFYAHVWAYKHFKGDIPKGHELHHRCPNHACINPDHLEPLKKPKHLSLGESPPARNARKTQCPKGHDPSEYVRDPKTGYRHCRICSREREKRRYHDIVRPRLQQQGQENRKCE